MGKAYGRPRGRQSGISILGDRIARQNLEVVEVMVFPLVDAKRVGHEIETQDIVVSDLTCIRRYICGVCICVLRDEEEV